MRALPEYHHHRFPNSPSIVASLLTQLLLLLPLLLLPTTTSAFETTVIVTFTATATETATATATTPRQDDSYTSPALFKSSILTTTNTYRAAHNASTLTWNETLASYASQWAETCMWEHSGGPYGENLAFGYTNATAAVQAWEAEASMYDFEKPTGFSEETGHFTQLVWKGTREVGCAAVDCGLTDLDGDGDGDEKSWDRAQGWYVVCEYVPGGNVVGPDDGLEYFLMNVQEGTGNSGSSSDSDSGDVVSMVGAGGGNDLLRLSIWEVGWRIGTVVYILSFV
ncbi:CAP domain-containing protein [Aspergillus aurantiobrunneus]